jgi:ribonuclease-3
MPLWYLEKSDVVFKPFRKFYNAYLAKDKQLSHQISTIVGFTPSHLSLFRLAFHHRSSNSDDSPTVMKMSNERLEFLGDAILSSVVAEYLFKKYPTGSEGFLTKMRSRIVKRKTLNQIASEMGLDDILIHYNDTQLSDSMKGNALEAFVGAIYLEKGYTQTRRIIVSKILRQYLDIHELETLDDNYKSQLLEYCQKSGLGIDYEMRQKYKFEKRDRFRIAVVIDNKEVSFAEAFSKKSAEQLASQKAMQILGITNLQNAEEHKVG